MAIKEIVKEGNPVLYKVSEAITSFDDNLRTLLKDLKDTLKDSGGIGIAAPQIGVSKRVVIINLGENTIELVNPRIVKKSGNQEDLEGCLSCPGQFGITKRPMHVIVEAEDGSGKKFTYKGKEMAARAFCHEIDHLDGILFKEHVIRMLTEEELKELEN